MVITLFCICKSLAVIHACNFMDMEWTIAVYYCTYVAKPKRVHYRHSRHIVVCIRSHVLRRRGCMCMSLAVIHACNVYGHGVDDSCILLYIRSSTKTCRYIDMEWKYKLYIIIVEMHLNHNM